MTEQLSPDVLHRITPHLPAFGITRVANVTGLDRLNVPVMMVCRPNGRSLSVFQGKGVTEEAARISGLMEAIECFHAENITHPMLVDSFANLRSNLHLNLNRMARLKGRVFDEQAPIPWIHGRDLISGREKLVPYQIVHMDCTVQEDSQEFPFISDTTGLASGADMTRAINHALSETIERDAQALWTLTRPETKALRKIRLCDVQDEFIQNFIASCDAADVVVAAWDITSDIGIPTILCKVMGRDYASHGVRPAFGTSTHLSPVVALQKAIAEAAQSRVTFISGARDDQYGENYDAQLSEQAYRRWYADVVEQPELLDFSGLSDLSCHDEEGNQALMLDMLWAQGFDEAVVVDLSKKEYRIPVVKVIVPGLEGISCTGQRLIGERGQRYYHEQGGHA